MEGDDLSLGCVKTDNGNNASRLFHVINATVNLVQTRNLAWQERKAAPFVFTPLHTGGDSVAYRPSSECSKSRSDWNSASRPLTLGTAMAISGAAVSPNMGYHSSPIVTFLLTLFNVRLGWWLGNPKHEKNWSLEGPKSAIPLLWKEAMGQTADDQPWLYLSDGGHFDNLGIYEMIRRRCRIIVVSDATEDPRFGFFDIGSTVRRVYTDFGVQIELGSVFMLGRRSPPVPGVYCAVGKIRYPGETEEGRIIYLKPGIYGVEPVDVRAYAASNRLFPHDPTFNQFFTESQFESYRSLGRHCITNVCSSRPTVSSLKELIDCAQDYVHMHEAQRPAGTATLVEVLSP